MRPTETPAGMPAAIAILLFGAALLPGGRPSTVLLERIAAAVAFGRRLERPLFIPTGGVPQSGRTEAEVMEERLGAAGIPASAILPEAASSDTFESVIACSRMLRDRGYVGPVAVVTSDFHMMRCAAMLRCAGWRVIPVPARSHPRREGVAGRLRHLWIWAREYPGTVWDVALVLRWVVLRRLGRGGFGRADR